MIKNFRHNGPIMKKHPWMLACLICLLTGCSLWHLLFGIVDVKKINHIRDEHGRIVIYHGTNHSDAGGKDGEVSSRTGL